MPISVLLGYYFDDCVYTNDITVYSYKIVSDNRSVFNSNISWGAWHILHKHVLINRSSDLRSQINNYLASPSRN